MSNDIKILVIADLERMRSFSKISDNRVCFLEYLERNCPQVKVISNKSKIKPNLNEILEKFKQKDLTSKQSIIIVHYVMGPGAGQLQDQIMVKGLENKSKNILTCIWLEDSGHIEKNSKIISLFESILFCVKQQKLEDKYRKIFPNMLMTSLDHYIDDLVFRDYGLNKTYDIIFYGYVDKQYPFRARLLKLLQSNSHRFRFKYIPHPGYWNLTNKTVITGKDLAKILNSSILSICTRSSSDLLLKKYFEALFCGCMPCGDIPTDYRELLKDKMLEVTPEMSDQIILDKIMRALKEKRKVGTEIRSQFSYQAGANVFVKKCLSLQQQHRLQK